MVRRSGNGGTVRRSPGAKAPENTLAVRQPQRVNQTYSLQGHGPVPGGLGTIANTELGLQFLQAAIAAPDFGKRAAVGVPDEFNGVTLVRDHYMVKSTNLSGSNSDHYILVAPTPGVAYWSAGFAPGNEPVGAWFPNLFADSLTMFPPRDPTNHFSEFRVCGLSVEIINTDSALTASGAVTLAKFDLSPSRDQSGDLAIAGDESFGALRVRADYSGRYKDGVYAPCFNKQADFEFQPMFDIHSTGPTDPGFVPGTAFNGGNHFTGDYVGRGATDDTFPLIGWGTSESVLIRISGGPDPTSLTVKVWMRVEYRVNQRSPFFDFATSSPPHDPLALETYRSAIGTLPVAVIARDNDTFWQRFVANLGVVSGVLGRIIPGPWGLLANAVSLGSKALRQVI